MAEAARISQLAVAGLSEEASLSLDPTEDRLKPPPRICSECGMPIEWELFEVSEMKLRRWRPGVHACPVVAERERRRQQELDSERRAVLVRELFVRSGMGEEYRDKTFATWDHGFNPDCEVGYTRCMEYVVDWPRRKENGRGLLLIGPGGVGKSHLAAAVMHALMPKGVVPVAESMPALLRKLGDSYAASSKTGVTFTKMLDRLLLADLIILDDLGAEGANPRMMFDVVNEIGNAKKCVVVTTNIGAAGGNLKALMIKAVGERVTERLVRMTLGVEMKGRSYRDYLASQYARQELPGLGGA